MGFLTFLLYFVASMFVWYGITWCMAWCYKKYVNIAFQKAIKDGKIKVVTLDDLSEEDDDTWH